MPIMLQSNHALLFDGVTDSVIIPQGRNSRVGEKSEQGDIVSTNLLGENLSGERGQGLIGDLFDRGFAIEAWVTPDCGGRVVQKDGQFLLSVGNVDTPGPAVFELNVVSDVGLEKVILRTAVETTAGYDGTVYPVNTFGGVDDAFNRFNSDDDATALTLSQRPLLHLVAGVREGKVVLFVNGVLMASQELSQEFVLNSSNEPVFIGGHGGQFRGIIESLHISSAFSDEMTTRSAPLVNARTACLMRFEEPISPITGTYTFSSIGSSSGLSTLNIGTTTAASLASALTGKTQTSGTVDFTKTPYSTGDYSVVDFTTLPGTKRTHLVPHVPFNLLINPGAVKRSTMKPNQSPPERVRLLSIDLGAGTALVSSVHLDFVNSTHDSRDVPSLHDGLRPVLHSRSSATGDDYFVVITGDSLIENGSGRPYQPPHFSTQIVDRTGQMVLDEGHFEQHGIVYSDRMATTASDSDNPFAVTWPSTLDASFQVGHSGRHTLNHVQGHHYLRQMADPQEEILDQRIDAADVLTLIYDAASKGIDKQFPMNSRVDYYRELGTLPVLTVVSSSTAYEEVDNGLTGASRDLIAIGGLSGALKFDPSPFFLKGPVPEDYANADAEVRKHHLRPSATSRIAVLEVSGLSSYGMSPYVEIHYNAIDLTGASMGKTAPMLMVEKTVPAANTLLSGSTYVLDVIETALSSGATLHAPGGVISFGAPSDSAMSQFFASNTLMGDNSEGFESDDELDERFTPQNYSTVVANQPRKPPQNIAASHTTATHESQFNRLVMQQINAPTETFTNRRAVHTDHTSPSNGQFDVGRTASASNVHEMFDIIDNHAVFSPNVRARYFVQPSNRTRTRQLTYARGAFTRPDDFNAAKVMLLMSPMRLRSVAEDESDEGARATIVRCVGMNADAMTRNVSEIGSGSPDSHVVKEIEPNAPVVTVTLGGVGQGAYDTKPTFDPSPMARLPYSTRRGYSVYATSARVDLSASPQNFLNVVALNNDTDDLKTWATYPFPKKGRIYLKTGASAEYANKTGVSFHFANASVGSGTYVLSDGREVASFHEWVVGSGLIPQASSLSGTNSDVYPLGEVILGDGHFFAENAADDGTTVNDRMFQSMDNVTHDYQLGTQFASTRALVEIPLFNAQFFENVSEGVLPGPDNSLKLHIDPTMTAHTWNPSPVGRRFPEKAPSDRSARGAYAYAAENSEQVRGATIIHKAEVVSGKYRLRVDKPEIFPAAVTSAGAFSYVTNVVRYRRAFLSNGEWLIYDNDPATDGYLRFEDEDWSTSENFLRDYEVGHSLMTAGGYESEALVPMESDILTSSSAMERRSEYYHDSASVKTQGGNVDYGLRQYVSAVEFKAGPRSNPHANRTVAKRASGTVLSVTPLGTTANFGGLVLLTFSEEDFAKFPKVPVPTDTNNLITFTTGDYHYELTVPSPDGSIRRFIYWGSAANVGLRSSDMTPENLGTSIVVQPVFTALAATTPNYLLSTSADFIAGETATLTKRSFDIGFSVNPADVALETTLNISDSFRPGGTGVRKPWTVTNIASTSSITVTNTSSLFLQSNTLGLTVKVNDYLYAETNTGSAVTAVRYLGRVTAIADYSASSSLPLTITLDGSMTSATQSNVNSEIAGGSLTIYLRVGCHDVMKNDDEAVLNRQWLAPYAQGGLRHGDTVWANMTYNNPHAVEGMFAKSRGVFNEALVWTGFNDGDGSLTTSARTSIPLENFLIGDSCLETAQNYAQHVNKTIELNYTNLGLSTNLAPKVAFVDPYLANEEHARVLLYDVAHDREFVAFQDLHMQVQTSAKAAEIGWQREFTASNIVDASTEIDLVPYSIGFNGASQHAFLTQIDVAAGFPSQNKYARSTIRSRFMESAYAHDVANHVATTLLNPIAGGSAPTNIVKELTNVTRIAQFGKAHGHFVHTGYYKAGPYGNRSLGDSILPRTTEGSAIPYWADKMHAYTRTSFSDTGSFLLKLREHRESVTGASFRDPSTLFDTPDGTRVVPAFLALKGIRSESLSLTAHDESRLQHLKQWTDMDFTRRLTIDLGEVGARIGGTSILAAANEVVRLINQAGAKQGRTHARRPSEQYPGESESLDLTRVGARAADGVRDPASSHINADFAATGSTHDPAVWWDEDKAFESHDKGTHMGYMRAHIGRIVQDTNGNEGFSIVVHSTVPGATGRNFCVWLDNSKGQSRYTPKFLIGHGGRYRTFWCQPDELSGENMHPAPMPLNKHGRPFAPVTTLQGYVVPDDSGVEFKATSDFAPRGDETSDPVMRAVSMATGSGQSHNTVNTESLEVEGFNTSYVTGLRTGNSAVARVNFGGLAASGVPGFAPDAGKWGFGRKGDVRIAERYGPAKDTSGSGAAATTYSSYVPAADVREEAIGNAPLYGFRFIDHRGVGHGIRFIYRSMGESFALDETQLPSTIDDEIAVFIDDRDVGQGGFTIGKHMHGVGDATGRFGAAATNTTLKGWRGNRWNPVPSPSAAYDCDAAYDSSSNKITVTLQAPYNACPHFDVLGYMGFPLSQGLLQLSDPFVHSGMTGSQGHVFSYTHRTREGSSGTHVFHGIQGSSFTPSHTHSGGSVSANSSAVFGTGSVNIRALISSTVNWTTLVTDELLAAITAAAINLADPNVEEGVSFDCRDMFASDGRTFGEWGVAEDAIRIRAFNTAGGGVRPLSDFFSASLHRDFAIQSAHVEFGDIEEIEVDNGGISLPSTSRAATDASIDNGLRAECGYLPFTVLQVFTKSKGSNSNTASPVLVDSRNNPVDPDEWHRRLIGYTFTANAGDHILPRVDNPSVLLLAAEVTSDPIQLTTNQVWHFAQPAGEEGTSISSKTKIASFGSVSNLSVQNGDVLVTSQNGSNSKTHLSLVTGTKTSTFPASDPTSNAVAQRFGDTTRAFRTAGSRVLGSVFSRPMLFFRGGRDSIDHSVPLFFGGGFSGVTLDINDGTKNDYSEFFTHPYAAGPTGVAGVQHANEFLSSYSMLDCNAMMAFFPGTPLLNQHRGNINPPFFNSENMLTPDLKRGTQGHHSDYPAPYSSGVKVQVPIPLVLRFAHPTARYSDHSGTTDSKTTYLIFGPGQAFPFTAQAATPDNSSEPHPGRALTVGNTWSKVPTHTSGKQFLHNHITNSTVGFLPELHSTQVARYRTHWRQAMNWEPAQGKSNATRLLQRPESGRFYGEMFTSNGVLNSGSLADYRTAHPLRHGVFMGFGMASNSDWCFHMDGGYHPGGSWLDNQLTFNPPHPNDNSRVAKSGVAGNELHPSAFRVAAPLANRVLYGSSASFASDTIESDDVELEYIAVDATKCQNGEEMAALLGSAINSFPGAGALKAMGGTFLPSMGTSNRQDRYGWVEVTGVVAYFLSANDTAGNIKTNAIKNNYMTLAFSTQALAEQVPESGWLRTSADFDNGVDSNNDSAAFAPYHSRIVKLDTSSGQYHVTFYLGSNRIAGSKAFESLKTWKDYLDTGVGAGSEVVPDVSGATKVYVWTKAGVHRWDNAGRLEGYSQVHFSGLVDAIDRTRPVGLPGWHGERYSYLNTLAVSGAYSAGLGAWHPSLGFSPFGGSMGCATVLGHLPHIAPMPNSPESGLPNDGSNGAADFPDYDTPNGPNYDADDDGDQSYSASFVDASGNNTPPITTFDENVHKDLQHAQGVYSRAMLVVAHESELALVAKRDRDGIKCVGDWLRSKDASSITLAGTTRWDDRIHGQDRFIATANAGPNIEALIVDDTTLPTVSSPTAASGLVASPFNAEFFLHTAVSADTELENAEPCRKPTGDLFLDIDKSIGSFYSASAGAQRNIMDHFYEAGSNNPMGGLWGGNTQKNSYWMGDVNGYEMFKRSPAKNFSIEHIVWKRMDGGSLSLPAMNARGLGAVPWVSRVEGSTPYTTGEKLLGNVRFSFETTNSAMMPIMRAHELGHPQLAVDPPVELRDVLEIPNEEMQFDDMVVVDDTGQTHTLNGGSPLGVVIRAYRSSGERLASGLAPSVAGAGLEPNMTIRLPDPNAIPGNILVRSGFDRVQAYQTETMGDGGMMANPQNLGQLFDGLTGPFNAPVLSEAGWEHIDKGENFPDSTSSKWDAATGDKPLSSAYELHDRTLFFHVTKMGHSHTDRYPTTYTHSGGLQNQALTVSSYASSTAVLTASASITTAIFDADFATKEVMDEGSGKRRRFLRLATATDSVVVSYTGISGATFTGVVGDIDFDQFLLDNPPASSTINVTPSYYVPAGSTRFFAARRLRDHAEVSGNSPDMAHTHYLNGNADTTGYARYSVPRMTPMPYPRMGHHFVNATMPMLPGHWAHPAYQGLYSGHEAERRATLRDPDYIRLLDHADLDDSTFDANVSDYLHPLNPQVRIGSLTATPSGPSDIHGGGFTLMFETKVRFDGYGVLASKGTAGDMNKAGGHSIVLEAGANYTQDNHFPDPAEVGAYQIVIQPNLHEAQIAGFHHNNSTTTALPNGSKRALTAQQIHLVVGIKYDSERGGSPIGGATLILAEATLADVRGCEIFVNEVILDHDPDHGSHFTNIPPMLLYNALGVQGSESPTFTRRTQPYHPGMFEDSTPGHTLNIPWWSIFHKVAPDDSSSTGFRHLALYRIDNFYQFCRASSGAVAAQLTLAGYPSISPDIYSDVMANVSLSPKCTVTGSGSGYIEVDDASFFPNKPAYGERLHYVDASGNDKFITYTQRSGTTHNAATMNQPDRFVTSASSPGNGTVLRLTRPYSERMTETLFTHSKSSVLTRIMPQMLPGSRDTNSLYTADAFLCMWHHNLGRPHTFYSDGSRTWGGTTTDRAINKAAYNGMPEHFETVHYHAVNYAASHGPFHLDFKTPKPAQHLSGTFSSVSGSPSTLVFGADVSGDGLVGKVLFTDGRVIGTVASVSTTDVTLTGDILYTPAASTTVYVGADGSVDTAANIHAMTGYQAQGGTSTMLTHYWPCGSRGGPLVSRLDGYAAWAAGWHVPRQYSSGGGKHWVDDDDDGSYAVSSGLSDGSLVASRTYPFGYRFGLRQPWNRPQWGFYGMRAHREESLFSGSPANANYAVGNGTGPLVAYETQTLTAKGGSNSNQSLTATYAGIMERQTNFSAMLGPDKAEWQVRYSDGRRMTRSFGCPVRTIRNGSGAPRDWWGDSAGLGISTIDAAVGYYLVDWWGNTRGEDIRRAPVRGFGIRPAWDAGDAYEYDRTNGRTPYARLYNNGKPIVNLKGIADSSGDVLSSPTAVVPRFGGRVNNTNNGSATTLVDVFAPTNALRVGDMGGGRGVRYPTQFNEDVLVEISDVYQASGVVLSGNTAEPAFGQGLIRPLDSEVQPDEIKRGISRRLGVDEDGLLKPDAVVSDRVESVTGTSVHKDAVSRSSPRIGIDGETTESLFNGVSTDMVAINSEAHSLHTDLGVGQRIVLEGGMQTGSQTLGDYDLTALSFAGQPHGGVMRFTHTSNIKPSGGTYVLESRSFAAPFDDTGWGRSGSGNTSNPFQTTTATSAPHNLTATKVTFMLRPVRLLDNQHVAVFRSERNVAGSTPQDGGTAYGATAGGKYGLFTYEATDATSTNYVRTTMPDGNAPYHPVYLMESSSDTVPVSKGPKLPGTAVAGFDSDSLKSVVTRLVVSENTLQHFRSDAPRRSLSKKDFSVKPRFSQSLHSKGHKGDVDYGASDHSGDAS